MQLDNWPFAAKKYGSIATIGNRRWFYRLRGQGTKTVIIEGGLGTTSAEWWHLQDQMAEFAQVLTYDRAGYGWSDKNSAPRSSRQIASELNELLETIGLPPPYILVGHSQGGLYLNHLARLYPEKVAGVLFLDPLSPRNNDFAKRLSPEVYKGSGVDKTRGIKSLAPLSRLGVLRLLKPLMLKSPPFYYFKDVPKANSEVVWQHMLRPDAIETALEEYAQAHLDANNQPLLSPEGFPHVPVTVIYHDAEVVIKEILKYGGLERLQAEDVEQVWESLVKEYSALGSSNQWLVAENASHYLHMDAPELVLGEVRKLVSGGQGEGVQAEVS
jgi:pimeloyl-ACP methyl ester carboxylesterase